MTTMYGIRNKTTGEMWHNRKGKTLWRRKGDAKNGWNAAQPYDYSRGLDQPRFDAEDHGLEIVEYSLIPTSELEELEDRSDWLRCLEHAGVDNWEGMSHAQELAEAERETSS